MLPRMVMAKKQHEPFTFTFEVVNPRLVSIVYNGYLAVDATDQIHQTNAFLDAAANSVGLIYTLHKFAGFDRAQIKMHVDIFTQHAKKIRGTALVGAPPSAHFAAITVGLMSKMQLKTF